MKDLLDYTDWERTQWQVWMRAHDGVLAVGAGTSSDGRFQVIGDLVRHIFSAEKRYVDRLMDRPITETGGIPIDDVDALFDFGLESRHDFRHYLERMSPEKGDAAIEMNLMGNTLVASPRKIATHILVHEMRHWAQIATLLRLNGFKVDMHDFIFSPAMGGELRRAAQ